MPDWFAQILPAIVGAVFAGGGAYYGVRIHLFYIRRDLDNLCGRVDRLERFQGVRNG
jgi:hypothetical protein